jgi:hypothetical protein
MSANQRPPSTCTRAISAGFLVICLFLAGPIFAQQETEAKPELVKSMGLPDIWKPYVGGLFGLDSSGPENSVYGELNLGIRKDLVNPEFALLALEGEGYAGFLGGEVDGGLRLGIAFPMVLFRIGWDYSFTLKRTDFMWTFRVPLKRGGLFGLGDDVRIDLIPKRNVYSIGISIPIGQSYMGKTRPVRSFTQLPEPSQEKRGIYVPPEELVVVLKQADESADWINRYTTPFFDQKRKMNKKRIQFFVQKIVQLKDHIDEKDENFPEGRTFEAEIDFYHESLVRAFTLAAGENLQQGLRITEQFREILFREVLVPYNRSFGQAKKPDSILGYAAAAGRQFREWLNSQSDIPADSRDGAMYVFRTLTNIIETHRRGSREHWKDSRLVWLPLHYALRLEDHDTQKEVNTILERMVKQEFKDANKAYYVVNEQFTWELSRMIHSARDYHVLWVHDFRGLNTGKKRLPDSVSYNVILEDYYGAWTERVKDYANTGKLPVFMIFLDQHYFEANKSKFWMKLLLDPLDHKLKLPKGYESWESEIARAQKDLNAAIGASEALQADVKRYGRRWLKNRIKVHVSVTNPSDLSFRSIRTLRGAPLIPDNLIRDHRKISFYDITELDPGKGEAIYAGLGVGEYYVGPRWEDRSMMVQGPGVLGVKESARKLLLSQGFKPHQIPPPLRPLPMPDNYQQQVEQLRESGWTTRGMQVHNDTGFGQKDTTLTKAVLYTMMPKGSYLLTMDQVWNSPTWAGMLVGAALRGCSVFAISPSLLNAPVDASVAMSRSNEIFRRLLYIQSLLEDEIQEIGGRLKIGIYNVDVDVQDVAGRGKILSKNLADNPWLLEAFPFQPSVLQLIQSLSGQLALKGVSPDYLRKREDVRMPKLHRKTQFFASKSVIETLLPLPEWTPLLEEYSLARVEQVQRETYLDSKRYQALFIDEFRRLEEEWLEQIPEKEREKAILYLTVGSHNQDFRSQMLDGEVLFVTAEFDSLLGFLDFFALVGLTTWVDDVAWLELWLPRYEGFIYRLGQWFRAAI